MENLDRIDYQDTFSEECPESLTAPQAVVDIFSSTPHWIRKLLLLRNKIVSPTGLKTEGIGFPLDVTKIKPGSVVGIVHVLEASEHKVVMGVDDNHLDFRVILTTENKLLSVTTQVKINNTLGKVYFFFVKPFHKIIVPAMIRAAFIKSKKQ